MATTWKSNLTKYKTGIGANDRKSRAINEGKLAKIRGGEIIDNPYLMLGKRARVYAGFWEKGFNSQD